MSNRIDWGKAAVNNTIDYGQGATDNTINWGKSQTLSPGGETNITGGGGTPSFSNTQSILLDGIDDFVDCGSTSYLQNLSEFSVSLWAKQTTATRNECFIGDWGYNTTGNFALETGNVSGNATGLTFYIRELSGTIKSITTQNYVFTENVWNHIAITFNSGTPNIYVNGTAQGLSVPSLPTSLAHSDGEINIGRFRGLGRNFLGGIDEVSIFNTELSQSDITSIYGGGTPSSLASLNPLSWWRFEGSGTTAIDSGSGGNNGTLTNGVVRSTDVPTIPFSTKSIALDGVDDFVTMGNVLNMADDGTDSFSCSFWMKGGSFSTEFIVSKHLNSSTYSGFAIYISNGKVVFRLGSGVSPNSKIQGNSTSLVIGSAWKNVIITYDGSQDISGFNVYINGVSDTIVTVSNSTPINVSNTTDFQLSGRAGGTSLVYGGSLDEVAFWNGTELTSTQASEIGSTLPTDLSTYNPTSWWRCGDGDSAPTLLDNGSGGNDGTMTNFTTFSTDVPT